jgi:tRNA-dihydrouridine synthase B
MVTSDSSLWHTSKSRHRLNHSGEPEPRSVQIAGGDANMMATAAKMNVDRGAQIIDINMGCPAKKVCKKAAGSALLKDQRLVREILEAVVNAVDVPVSLKIRTGWSPEQRNGVAIAHIAEQCGIAALAVHGRTKACKFNGQAEYDTIAAIKQAVAIPIIANGDIDSPHKALQVMQQTGADAVMVGRAAQGRPWLCNEINHYLSSGELLAPPDSEQICQILLQHLQALYAFYGEFMATKIARKHVGWYLQAASHSAALETMTEQQARCFRQHFNQLETAAAQCLAIEAYFRSSDNDNDPLILSDQTLDTDHRHGATINKEVIAA